MTEIGETKLSTLAEQMLSDYDSATPGLVFADGLRLDIPDAWRLQAAVADLRKRRGERVVGYKVGCVREGNQRLNGLTHPAYGRLWQNELYPDGATLKKAGYENPSMEAEFGITLSAPILPERTSLEHVLPAIRSIHPAIEIHNLVTRGEAPHGHELLANNAFNAGVVLGNPITITDISHTRETDLKLIYDGEVVDEWSGLKWPMDMLEAIDWLVGELHEQGIELKEGDLILTGAWGPPIPIHEKTRIEVTSSEFGKVSAVFE